MLAYVTMSGTGVLMGAVLLLCYSIGHCVLLIIGGTFIGFVQSLSGSGKFAVVSRIIRIILGIIMLAFAAYFIYMAFYI